LRRRGEASRGLVAGWPLGMPRRPAGWPARRPEFTWSVPSRFPFVSSLLDRVGDVPGEATDASVRPVRAPVVVPASAADHIMVPDASAPAPEAVVQYVVSPYDVPL